MCGIYFQCSFLKVHSRLNKIKVHIFYVTIITLYITHVINNCCLMKFHRLWRRRNDFSLPPLVVIDCWNKPRKFSRVSSGLEDGCHRKLWLFYNLQLKSSFIKWVLNNCIKILTWLINYINPQMTQIGWVEWHILCRTLMVGVLGLHHVIHLVQLNWWCKIYS